VNVVIANHGTMGPVLDGLPTDRTPTIDEMYQYLWKTPMTEFNDAFNVNTTAVFYLFVAFMPLLDAGNTHPGSPTVALGIDSQFIATSSISAFSRVPKAGFAYSGSKLAVTHIVKQIATNMAPYHIRANVIAPGIYPSVMSEVRAFIYWHIRISKVFIF
jgi:NAD(P)-dependent dehydrogenase (short-subunit alcohol dehydrogenase family)